MKEGTMKKSITILVLCSLFVFAGILPGAIPAPGPSDAFTKGAVRPAFLPVITEGDSASVTMDEDASPVAFALTLNATDGDGDTLSWSISSAASHGTATASGTGTSKVIGYVPNADWNGTDSFIVMVSDGADGSDTITVNVTVDAHNDGPVNIVPGTQTVDEDTNLVFSTGTGNPISMADADVAETVNGKLQVTLTVSHGSLTLHQTTGLTFTTGDGTSDATMTFTALPAALNSAMDGVRYTPAADYSGTDNLSVSTSDQGNTGAGGVLTDSDIIPITVTGINDSPIVGSVAAANVVDADTGATAYDFTVTFTDDSAINVSTLDNGDVYVITPGAGTIAATFISVDTPGDGTPRTATYRIVPPGGSWDVTDNGTYTIGIYGSQVADADVAYIAANANIGPFSVAVVNEVPVITEGSGPLRGPSTRTTTRRPSR